MKRLLITLLILTLALSTLYAQSEPVPTLVAPTLIPSVNTVTITDELRTDSTIARIIAENTVRVGVLYNEPPFGVYTLQGEARGFEPDLARLFAELWGVDLELIQVTRQNRFDKLKNGEVDLLMAAVVTDRALDLEFDFSQPYRLGRQAMMVRSSDEFRSMFNLANRPVGYVIGTPSEVALNDWLARTGVPIQSQLYYTLDAAYAALFGGEVDAIVGRETHLIRISQSALDEVTIFDETIQSEPYAAAVLEQDAPLRDLINQSLQYLLSDGTTTEDSTLESLYLEYFGGSEFPFDTVPVYRNLAEAPTPAQFNTQINYPQQYTLNRIQQNGILRVGGIIQTEGVSATEARLASRHRQLIDQMAQRWQIGQVDYVTGNPYELIASGQIDIAIGLTPDWNQADTVDYTQPYLLHGERFLIPANRDYDRFTSLRGRIVSTISGDADSRQRAESLADSVGGNIRFFETTEEGIARTLQQDNNADVVYGDTLTIIPVLRDQPNAFKLGTQWYTREYLTIAVPDNDNIIRQLVDVTLQEMAREGTLTQIFAQVTPPDEPAIRLGVSPGQPIVAGISAGR